MKNVEQLIVSLLLEGKEIEVGELVSEERKIYFKYYPKFTGSGLEISPFKLPLTDKIVAPEIEVLDGLFGVFYDSLPDGWGRLLLDRTLASKGILPSQVTALDRLSFVGQSGAGALVYKPGKESVFDFKKQIELDSIAAETKKILEGTASDVIEELHYLGGSSGGARPKILVGWNSKTDHLIFGKDNLPEGYEHWIIKFPTSTDAVDIANIEFAYYQMATAAGLKMSECRLFGGGKGSSYFGTKRFDRIGNNRLHLHSAAGLLHDNFRLSSMDYGHLMDAAFRLEKHIHAYEKVLRLAAFNVMAHNRDDHSKNVSFLMNKNGEWSLAPAYDLTFSNSAHGFQSMAVAGESANPKMENLLELAAIFGISRPEQIIEEVKTAIGKWKAFAKDSGVTRTSANLIGKVIG